MIEPTLLIDFRLISKIPFSELPQKDSTWKCGNVYEITDTFTTDERFICPNIECKAGSHVVILDFGMGNDTDLKYDIF